MAIHHEVIILIPMYAYADSTVFYGVQPEDEEHQVKQLDTLLRDYFQLDRVSLQSCYKRWSDLDANFKAKAIHFAGIRMLRQDPWENLVSFICSSNNNIPRISQMVNNIHKQKQQTSLYSHTTLSIRFTSYVSIMVLLFAWWMILYIMISHPFKPWQMMAWKKSCDSWDSDIGQSTLHKQQNRFYKKKERNNGFGI